jgi:hypothetical protein
VPTIAVATDGGVSVITDGGDVWDLTHTLVTPEAGSVFFPASGGIAWTSRESGDYLYLFREFELPTADKSTAPDKVYGTSGQASQHPPAFMQRRVSSAIDGAVAGVEGVTFLAEDTTTPDNSMVAYTASTFNTGWMNGDIKGAFLSDTDDTDLVDTEFVTLKTPVATGADLVAYSGFSASNYLEQPYNSDLDFGTGDFCIMGWVQESAASDWIVDRMEGRDGSSNIWGFNVWQSSQSLRFAVSENGASTSVTATTVMGNGDGVWHFFTAVRRSGVLEMYMQGNLEATTSGTVRNISYTSTGNPPPLIIGAKEDGSQSFLNGKAALLRISATAPSAGQIAKIYNDEKFLFQENAQATLYGSSDAVTALAHDSDTDLLHVGTSAGRSVFQGLRRVSNTTTAVGTAISASTGLVVEE